MGKTVTVTDEMADAYFKIGEGFQDLGRAIARRDLGESPEENRQADLGDLDISGETTEGRRRRQAIVLRAFEKADGRLHKDDFYKIAQSVGYDNRGLAGWSTGAANLVEVEKRERMDTGYRLLTEAGQRRLDVNRHLLPSEE